MNKKQSNFALTVIRSRRFRGLPLFNFITRKLFNSKLYSFSIRSTIIWLFNINKAFNIGDHVGIFPVQLDSLSNFVWDRFVLITMGLLCQEHIAWGLGSSELDTSGVIMGQLHTLVIEQVWRLTLTSVIHVYVCVVYFVSAV